MPPPGTGRQGYEITARFARLKTNPTHQPAIRCVRRKMFASRIRNWFLQNNCIICDHNHAHSFTLQFIAAKLRGLDRGRTSGKCEIVHFHTCVFSLFPLNSLSSRKTSMRRANFGIIITMICVPPSPHWVRRVAQMRGVKSRITRCRVVVSVLLARSVGAEIIKP